MRQPRTPVAGARARSAGTFQQGLAQSWPRQRRLAALLAACALLLLCAAPQAHADPDALGVELNEEIIAKYRMDR